MARTLGLGIGLDFAKLDKDLNTVADKIEAVGKSVQVKLGGDGGGKGIDTGQITGVLDQLGPRLGQVGVMISQGIATGIRSASASMLAFTGRISAMLDRLSGTAITMFHRIDAAMKFPTFQAFWQTAQLKVTNFAAFWRKPLSDIDLATSGAFGGMVQKIARLFTDLADRLAVAIADGVRRGVGAGEASVAGLMGTTTKAPTAQRFPMGGAGLATSIPGPRIGAQAGLTAPVAMPKIMYGHELKTMDGEAKDFFRGMAIGTKAVATPFAALMVLPLKGITTYRRLSNFFSSLGDVAKKTYTDIYGGEMKAVEGAKQHQAAMAATDGAMTKVGNTATAVGVKLLAAFGVVGVLYKVVEFFKAGVMGASSLNETVKVSKGIFGDSFGVVQAQADATSKKYGVMREEQLKVANQFGVMAQGANMTERASAELANSMTQLTLNFAAEWQIPFTDAADKIQQGLAGSAKGLKEYGVWNDEATTKTYAIAHGARLYGGELSKQDALMARTAIVTRGLAYSVGALDRTSGGAAAQFKKAGGGVGEFGVRIGELLLPAVQAATVGFNEFLGAVIGVVEYAGPGLTGFVSIITGAMQITGAAISKVGSILGSGVGNVVKAMMPTITQWSSTFMSAVSTIKLMAANLGIVWEIVGLKVGAFVENSIRWLNTLPENFGRITKWLGRNWMNLIVDLGSMLSIGFNNLITNVATFGVALWEAMKSDWFRRNWYNMLVDLGTMMSSAFTNLLGNATKFGTAILSAIKGEGFKFEWTPLLEGFKATTEKMPELLKDNFKWKPLLDGFEATTEKLPDMVKPALINVDDQVKELWGKMKPPPGVAEPAGPKKPGPIEDMKTSEYKLSAAAEIGSKEASSIVAKTQATARGNAGKDQLAVAKDSNSTLKDIRDAVKNPKPQFKVA